MTRDSLGDRMKTFYEQRNRHCLARRTPVIIRVDGRAFHTFTSRMARPFSEDLRKALLDAATAVVDDMMGCEAPYAQSDEVSFLLTDYVRLQTQAWFDYDQSKLESITAAIMTVRFRMALGPTHADHVAVFDARAFNVPREEVCNYFLWRMKDWERNSLSMFARTYFSTRELHKKNKSQIHEMLHGVGRNWTHDVDQGFRNGTWILPGREGGIARVSSIEPRYDQIADILNSRIYPPVAAEATRNITLPGSSP